MIEKPYYLCTSPPCSCHGCWPTGSAVSAVATAGHCSGQGAIRIANLDHCAWSESGSTKYVRMCIRILKFRNTANLEHQTGDNSHPDPQIQEKPAQILDDPHPAPQISGDADPEA